MAGVLARCPTQDITLGSRTATKAGTAATPKGLEAEKKLESKLETCPYFHKASAELKSCNQARGSGRCKRGIETQSKSKGREARFKTITKNWDGATVAF